MKLLGVETMLFAAKFASTRDLQKGPLDTNLKVPIFDSAGRQIGALEICVIGSLRATLIAM